MKFTEGAFRDWGYELAARRVRATQIVTEDEVYEKHGGKTPAGKVVIKDRIADSMFQQSCCAPTSTTSSPRRTSTATTSPTPARRRSAASGIAPGRQHRRRRGGLRGHPRHRAQVRRPGQGQPGLGDPLGRDDVRAPRAGTKPPTLIEGSVETTIAAKTVTYDLARQMEGAKEVSCSGFASAMIENLYEPRRRDRRPTWQGVRVMARKKIALIGAGNIGGTLAHLALHPEPRRRRPLRRRRRAAAGQGARPLRRRPDRGLRRHGQRHQQLRRHRRRRRLHHHRRPRAQAGHEPRRPARDQLQDHEVGRARASSSTRPTRSSS